jgi:hypothetical protein
MTMTTDQAETMERLRALMARYDELRPAADRWTLERAGQPRPEHPRNPASEDEVEWDPGQVLAHLAETCQYWLGELERILDAAAMGRGPVAIGRALDDPSRTIPVECDRYLPARELYARIGSTVERAGRRLTELDADGRSAAGVHPRMGTQTAEQIVRERILGHLEGHITQLADTLGADEVPAPDGRS